jgi:neutral ceramidase
LILIGDVALAAVPGELTTMSGRRLRDALARTSLLAGGKDVQVIVAGLSNMYSSYVATYEEFQVSTKTLLNGIKENPNSIPIADSKV